MRRDRRVEAPAHYRFVDLRFADEAGREEVDRDRGFFGDDHLLVQRAVARREPDGDLAVPGLRGAELGRPRRADRDLPSAIFTAKVSSCRISDRTPARRLGRRTRPRARRRCKETSPASRPMRRCGKVS